MQKRGFTLVELLVVIAIIGILIALLIPAVQSVRETARRMQCASNIRQMAIAATTYENSHQRYPTGGTTDNEVALHVYILPFMEQGNLYKTANFAPGDFDDPGKQDLSQNRIPTFLCGSSSEYLAEEWPTNQAMSPEHYTTHYYGVMDLLDTMTGPPPHMIFMQDSFLDMAVFLKKDFSIQTSVASTLTSKMAYQTR